MKHVYVDIYIYIYIYIPHCKYQVKPDSSPWFLAAIVYRNCFFCLYQQNKSSESKLKFRQAINHYKKVLEVAVTSKKLGSCIFCRIANNVLNRAKPLLYCLYWMAWSCYLLHLIKQNCLLKIFKNSCPCRTNLKLHHISVTAKMFQRVIINLDLSKASSGLDCIPVVVYKNCEPELLHILPELLNMCLKKSCIPDCWKISLVVHVF